VSAVLVITRLYTAHRIVQKTFLDDCEYATGYAARRQR